MSDEIRVGLIWQSSGKGAVIADAREIGTETATQMSKAAEGVKYMSDTMKSTIAQYKAMKNAAGEATGSVDALTVSQRAMRDAGVSLDQILSAVNRGTVSLTDQRRIASQVMREQIQIAQAEQAAMDRSRAMMLAHADAIAIDAQMTERAAGAARAMALAQAQAIAINEAGAVSAGAHAFQAARLNMELGTAAGRLLGVNSAVTRLLTMVSGASLGYGPIIAAVGAIVALAEAWKMWNAEALKAQEQQDELTKSLEKWYDTERLGVGGEHVAQLDAETKRIADLTLKYERLRHAQIQSAGGADASEGSVQFGVLVGEHADAMEPQLQKSRAEQKAVQDATNKDLTKAIADRETQYVNDLAHLIKYRVASTVELHNAAAMLADFQRQLTGAAKAASPDMRNNIVEWMHTLDEALHPKTHTEIPPFALESNKITEALVKQLDEMRKVNVEDNKSLAIAAQNAELAKVQGVAHELLANHYKSENDQMVANATLSGLALAERIKTIKAVEDQDKATILATTASKDAAEAAKLLNEQHLHAAQVAPEVSKQYEHLAGVIQGDLLRAVEAFSSKGITSFSSFFQEVERLATQEIDHITKALSDSSKFTKQQIADLTSLKSLAQSVGAGVAGGVAGYQIGQATRSTASGLIGGAASGAITGNEILPGGWGAVIGGLAGAAGGLLGAAQAQKDAAKAYADSVKSLNTSLGKFTNPNDTLGAGIADVHSQADAFRQSIHDTMVAGLKEAGNNVDAFTATLVTADQQIKSANAGEALRIAMLVQEDKLTRSQYANDLAVRNLRAQGLSAEADAMAAAIARGRELTDAITKFGASSATVASLLQTQAAEAAWDKQVTDAKAFNDAFFARMDDQAAHAHDAQNAVAEQARKQQQILQDAVDALNKQLDIVTVQRDLQQKTVDTLRATTQALQTGADALKIGGLSALSPAEQYAESLRQLKEFVAKAQAGEAGAAQDVVGAANTFLQESKMMYASSAPYGDDFNYVQSLLSGLGLQYNDQLTTAEKMLAALQGQDAILAAQVQIMNAQLRQLVALNYTYTVGTPQDPNFLAENAKGGANTFPVPGATDGIYGAFSGGEYNPFSTGSYVPAGVGATGGGGPGGSPGAGWRLVPGLGWQNGNLPGNEWLLDSGYPGYANGGMFGGGLRAVGEQGMELEVTGPSRIINNGDTKNMLATAIGSGANVEAAINRQTESIEKLSKQQISDGRTNANEMAGRVDKLERKLDALARLMMFSDRNTGTG